MYIISLKRTLTLIISAYIVLNLTACVTTTLPKVSHVHIGHAMTAWHKTPEQKGLFVTAEEEAMIALEYAKKATDSSNNIDQVKKHIESVQHAMDPTSTKQGPGKNFGFIKAMEQAQNHIIFAADSEDASENIKKAARIWVSNSDDVAERNNLITALNAEILELDSSEEALILAEEVRILAYQNINGVDLDGNGVVGNTSKEYGIKQLKVEMQKMIDNENPPYEVIDKKYLFGLVQLPNGLWRFVFDRSGGSVGGY